MGIGACLTHPLQPSSSLSTFLRQEVRGRKAHKQNKTWEPTFKMSFLRGKLGTQAPLSLWPPIPQMKSPKASILVHIKPDGEEGHRTEYKNPFTFSMKLACMWRDLLPFICFPLLLLLLARFSRVRLYTTPEMAAHQASPSLGFSRQEHWSWLPFPSPMQENEK